MRQLIVVLIAFAFLSTSTKTLAFTDDTLVKLSASGICHPPESPYYARTKDTSTTELTLKQCLDQGGRLPAYLQQAYDAKSIQDDAASTAEQKAVAKQAEIQALAKNDQEQQSVREFAGLRFGFGIGMTFIGEQIDEVRIIEGKVAITKERSNQGRAILESHKFIWGTGSPEEGRFQKGWGWGPFVAASLTDDQGAGLLSAYGAGLMAGFRSENTSSSWNIGIGWFVDTEVKTLRPGIVDGMDTMLMNSDDLIRKVDKEGLIILVSGSW